MNATWHVLGTGAIGGLFARRLHQTGTPVVLLSRHADQPTRTLRFVEHKQHSVVTLPCETGSDSRPVNRLLVCTKAPDVLPALQQMTRRIGADTELLVLVNGMGVGERVREQFPNNPIVIGTTTAACFRDADGHWHPVADGETYLGWLENSHAAPGWVTDWQRAVPGFHWQSSIEEKLLAKLAVNSVINPATALLDVRNGAIIEPPLADLTRQACAEVTAVLAQAGHAALSATVQARVWSVAAATAANTSSMRADLLAERPSEVEVILGYLLETLKPKADRPPATPLLDEWLERLRHYESSRLTPGSV